MTFLASLLVLPLALLLFLQWPLREWMHAYSRQANDLGQILFALYVAVALYAASLGRTHLAAVAGRGDAREPPGWRAWVSPVCLVPWTVFMLWASWGTTAVSVRGLERFPETATPGYFLLKLALVLLLVLVLLQAVRAAWPEPAGDQ
jgi:hypothetical protein